MRPRIDDAVFGGLVGDELQPGAVRVEDLAAAGHEPGVPGRGGPQRVADADVGGARFGGGQLPRHAAGLGVQGGAQGPGDAAPVRLGGGGVLQHELGRDAEAGRDSLDRVVQVEVLVTVPERGLPPQRQVDDQHVKPGPLGRRLADAAGQRIEQDPVRDRGSGDRVVQAAPGAGR